MKSEISESVKEPSGKYPYLGIIKDGYQCTGLIVLFTSERTGVCVAQGENKITPVGEYSTEWGEQIFKPFAGLVTLSND